MKIILNFIFILLFLNVNGQVLEKNSITINESKNIPFYELDSCVAQLLKNIVNNCIEDTSLIGFPYGYLFYSKKHDTGFSIVIKPFETSKFYNANFYGVFTINNQKFYCVGDKPDILLNMATKDSLKVVYWIRETKHDSIAVNLNVNRLSDLNTIQFVKNISLNNILYSFYIQPCSNLSKKVLRKIKYNSYCK